MVSEIQMRYSVKWKVYNEVGDLIEEDGKLFETKNKADEFAIKLKKSKKKNYSIRVIIVKLEHNEIVTRLKKERGKKNYKRQ